MPVANKLPETPNRAVRRRRVVKPTQQFHPLAAMIPDEERLTGYASRKVGGVDDLVILDVAAETRHNVAIFGPTGSAKTSLLMAWARSKMYAVVIVPCNGAADPQFFFGGWRPNPDGTFSLRPGQVYYAMRYGRAIVMLDEMNFLPPKMSALFHSPLDGRRLAVIPDFDGAWYDDPKTAPKWRDWRIENNMDPDGDTVPILDRMGNPILSTFKVHEDCLFAASWNPDYAGTYEVNEALFNRFNHKVQFGYNSIVEAELLDSGSLIEMAAKLRAASQADDVINTAVSTNSLIEFEENALNPKLGFAYAMENFISMFKPDEQNAVKEILRQHQDAMRREILQAGVAQDTDDDTGDDYDDIEDEQEDF